jgi:hypothetical protein
MEGLLNVAYAKAKGWGFTYLTLQATLYLLGVAAIFVPRITLTYPLYALPLALVSAWLIAQANRYKGIAEALKRQHEYVAGFGQAPCRRLLADLKMELPHDLSSRLDEVLREGITYASKKPFGAARVVENLAESAWFSRHMARYCVLALRAVFILTLVVAVVLLLLCAISLGGTPVGVGAAKCVSATFLFLISVGTLRFWLSYDAFSRKSEQTEVEASRLQSAGEPDLREAQRLLAEYQLARAAAPLIPTWMWLLFRKRLNNNWALRSARD